MGVAIDGREINSWVARWTCMVGIVLAKKSKVKSSE